MTWFSFIRCRQLAAMEEYRGVVTSNFFNQERNLRCSWLSCQKLQINNVHRITIKRNTNYCNYSKFHNFLEISTKAIFYYLSFFCHCPRKLRRGAFESAYQEKYLPFILPLCFALWILSEVALTLNKFRTWFLFARGSRTTIKSWNTLGNMNFINSLCLELRAFINHKKLNAGQKHFALFVPCLADIF